MSLDPDLHALLQKTAQDRSLILFLTGAGISAESGIPTFRGPDGYWTRDSRVYQPEQLATWAAFSADPQLVWPWYLYRRGLCQAAQPSAAHLALADLEAHLGSRFILVTQNVDGLHLRAGNSLERTWQIHGNIDFMRCAQECSSMLAPVPDLGPIARDSGFDPQWRGSLQCPECGGWTRPHVLWFDESYDEERYRYMSARHAATQASLLIVVGTAGATSLPRQMGQIAHTRGTPIIDINPDHNPFAALAEAGRGGWIAAPASQGMAWITDGLTDPCSPTPR
jgi:NAD-dependent deacetylase